MSTDQNLNTASDFLIKQNTFPQTVDQLTDSARLRASGLARTLNDEFDKKNHN
jgi:hypothetical protein